MPCAIPPLDQAATRVGRGYGEGWNRERTSDEQLHGGMDFVADAGTPVLAPIPGRVLFVSSNAGPRISASQAQAGSVGQVRRMGGYGNSVVLEHDLDVPGLPRPFWTSYNHLQAAPALSPGQAVATGDLLGQVGNTTNNQFRGMGAHLHMEVRRAAFPGPVGHDGYELDTVDPSLLFSALGIDWVDSHREVGRGVGGQMLIRTGGPSDCPATLSGLGQPCCGRGGRRLRGLGVLPSVAAPAGTYISPDYIRSKYASKGLSRKSVSETSPTLLPPDYSEAAEGFSPPTNWLPWVAGGVVALVIGAALLKKKRGGLGSDNPFLPGAQADWSDDLMRATEAAEKGKCSEAWKVIRAWKAWRAKAGINPRLGRNFPMMPNEIVWLENRAQIVLPRSPTYDAWVRYIESMCLSLNGLGMQPRDPYAHDIRDLVKDYQDTAMGIKDNRELLESYRTNAAQWRKYLDSGDPYILPPGVTIKRLFLESCSGMKRSFLRQRDLHNKIKSITSHSEWPNVVRHFQNYDNFSWARDQIDDAIIQSKSAKAEYERLGCSQAFEPWMLPATIR